MVICDILKIVLKRTFSRPDAGMVSSTPALIEALQKIDLNLFSPKEEEPL